MPGPDFAPKPYINTGNARRYLALPSANKLRCHVEAWLIPKGTMVIRGKAADMTNDPLFGEHAEGGGVQLYVQDLSVATPVK